jgi:arylformamidase
MPMQIHDITVPLREGMPVWPGDPSPRFWLKAAHDRGDAVDVTEMALVAHTGTHLDAPRHFIPGGGLVHELDLRVLLGPVHVVHFNGDGPIPVDFFEAENLPDPLPRLLLRCSGNAGALAWDTFFEDYVAITPEAAEWLVRRGCRLIGTDYLSIGGFREGNRETHLVLLGASVIIVEGLDLRDVEPGVYTLVCLPLALPADGSPCRALLLPAGALPDPLDAR